MPHKHQKRVGRRELLRRVFSLRCREHDEEMTYHTDEYFSLQRFAPGLPGNVAIPDLSLLDSCGGKRAEVARFVATTPGNGVGPRMWWHDPELATTYPFDVQPPVTYLRYLGSSGIEVRGYDNIRNLRFVYIEPLGSAEVYAAYAS